MDIGLTSIFAEYNRELLNQYDLLAIDATYGNRNGDAERTKSHLLQYMNMNFSVTEQIPFMEVKDLTALHADNAVLSEISYLADKSGEVMKYQIVQGMKERTGLSYAEDMWDSISCQEKEAEFEQLENRRLDSHGKIDQILTEMNASRKEEEEKISIDNPADQVDGMRSGFLLDLAVKDSGMIRRDKIVLSQYISHRGAESGEGLWHDQKIPDGIADNFLFQKYLFDKCGYYSQQKEDSLLGYQLEYILYGKDNDFDNLNEMAEGLFKIRYVTNSAYLFSNASKMNEAGVMAAAVTTGLGSPQLAEAVKITILFAWCYAETIQDLRILFDGKSVADIKTDTTWNTPLSELLLFTTTLDSYHEAPGGKTYRDYLAGFLMLKPEQILRMRLMDIMEMDIRKTRGNSNFKMDQCIYQLNAVVNVSAKYGYGYSIARKYSYE